MRPGPKLSRRRFLKSAAAGLAAPYVLTSAALGAEGRPPASERITMGAIGLGGMGGGDLRGFLGFREVQMVAVCDVDARHVAGARKMVNDHYGTADCAATADFREITRRDDVDAVMIATPDHWHALPVLDAARHGQDIHCQKPLSLTIAEGRAMSDAVRRYGRVFQTGSQQRSNGRFWQACMLARNGRLGRLHTIRTGLPTGPQSVPLQPEPVPGRLDYDRWLGSAPWAPYQGRRCHRSFRWILDYSGGQVTDWGAHHNDIAQWGGGYTGSGPVEIEGRAEWPRPGLYNTAIHYEFTATYADGVRLVCTNRFPNGCQFEGDLGRVRVWRGGIEADPPSLLQEEFGPDDVRLVCSRHHRGNFLECVKSRRDCVAPIEDAHRSVTVCHLGNIAMLLERKVRWDPKNESFIGDDEANRMRRRAMRPPWRL